MPGPMVLPVPTDRYDRTNEGALRRIIEQWSKDVLAFISRDVVLRTVTDATRASPGTAGRVVYNSDDTNINIDTGSDWILPDGTVVT